MGKTAVWICLMFVLMACSAPATSRPTATNEPGDITTKTATQTTVSSASPQIQNGDISAAVPITVSNASQLSEIRTLSGHSRAISQLDFHPNGESLASSSEDGTVRVWDISSGSEYVTFDEGNEAFGVSFDSNGDKLASGNADSFVRVWDLQTGELENTLAGHTWGVLDVVYSPDGEYIASSGYDNSARIWSAAEGTEIFTLRGHTDTIYSIIFHPTEPWLLTSSQDQSVRTWDLESGKQINAFQGNEENVIFLDITPDGKHLVTCGGGLIGKDNSAKVWDVYTGEELINFGDFPSAVVVCKFSKHGDLLITRTATGEINFWDLESQQQVKSIEGPALWPPGVDLSPNGSILAFGDNNGTIHLYAVLDE